MAARKNTLVSNPSRTSPKRIAAAIALAFMASAGSAWAAGLGRLTVQSALGQPLRAEVEISSLSRDEAGTLTARLAPAEAFRQAGLEFNPALNTLRFAIDRRDGRAVVRITSIQPINEPFVDLLVELNWANGRYVREYTFLLDPPELRSGVRESVEGGASQQTQVTPPATTRREAPAERPAPERAPAPARAARGEPAPVAGDKVEVRRGDTLAGIAAKVKPSGVTLDQALISLYQANPRAFFGSIHQLKEGATLAVPDQQAMAAVDAGAAREQIRVQTQDFNAYRARLADSARAIPTAKAGQSAAGSIGAQVEDKGAPPASRDQLRLSKSEPGATGGAASAATGSAPSKAAAAEQGVARDAALRESQSRVADLEKNVGDLQKLVELKNRQLAELQKQIEEAKTVGKSAAGAIAKADATAPAAAAARAPEPAAAPSAKVEPAKAEAAKSASAPATPAAAPAAEAAKADEPKQAPAPEAAKAEAPKAPAKPAAPPPKAPEPSFVDELMDNPLMLPGLGAVVALGLGYGWYAMRRRRKVEKFEDSLIAPDGFAQNSLFGSTGGQAVDTTASIFAATTKDSGVDVHSTEVDPIAEAEVYIAYGREAQAEEILKEALKKQPDRQAIRTKLLEIYSGRREVASFNALATEMYEMSGGQNEEWPKVVTLGLGLDPSNPLYGGGASGPGEARAVAPEAQIGGAAAGLAAGLTEPDMQAPAAFVERRKSSAAAQPAAGAARPAAAPVMPAAPEEPVIDFGVLEDPAAAAPAPAATAAVKPAAEPEPAAIDFDLDFDLDTTIGKAGEMLAAGRGDEAPARSDLEQAVGDRFELPSLDLGAVEAVPARTEPPAIQGLDALDIDLPALEGVSRMAAPSPAAASAAAADSALDLDALGLDLEPPPAGPAGGDSAQWQEMATKLDLASAYEEIGDKEGARELLDEVMKGGDAEQQRKAKSMLAKIA